MGLASWLGYSGKSPMPAALLTQSVDIQSVLASVLDQPVEQLWREQPHLRTVVGFIARNIAQLGLQAFERDQDGGRNRLRNPNPLALLLDHPNADDTQYELLYGTISALCLYDMAYWYVAPDATSPSGWTIRQIPTTWIIGTTQATAFSVGAYRVAIPNTIASAGAFIEIPAADMLVFHGWNPKDAKIGTSPVISLKTTLSEQIHAQIFREQMWRRGGRVGQYIVRPANTPWSPEARGKWVQEYRDNYSGDDAPKAGGEPLFEDGMELKSARFSAKDEQWAEASKLSLQTCAQVFYINPTMIGVLDNANYSNVREFRKMLYGDNLGPTIEHLQQRVNRFLVPRVVKVNDGRTYTEFNLQSKLAGSFEEQAQVFGTAIGGPWMTRNEGRAKQNMPSIEGGDELIMPLNLTQPGDQNPIAADDVPTPPTPTEPADEESDQ